jgi:hypothetical protein
MEETWGDHPTSVPPGQGNAANLLNIYSGPRRCKCAGLSAKPLGVKLPEATFPS